jgi:hypothetical protein
MTNAPAELLPARCASRIDDEREMNAAMVHIEKAGENPPAFRSTMHNVEALLALLGRLLRRLLLAGGLAA